MKFSIKPFVFSNQSLRFFLISIMYLLSQYSYSQKINITTDTTTFYKNSIKGMGEIFGALGSSIYGFSVGYERNISMHSILELGGYYFSYTDPMGSQQNAICVMAGYKYVVTSNKEKFNNTWYSVYLSYYLNNRYYPESNQHFIDYLNGIGCSLGRKIYISKDNNIFIEVGIGASINIFNIEPKTSIPSEPLFILPRPILQIGGKF